MSKRDVYVYSSTRQYLQPEYITLFEEKNATLYEGTLDKFEKFCDSNTIVQLDTETNVTDFYCDRELYVVQIGNYGGSEQHLFDITDLTSGQNSALYEFFCDNEMRYIAHNAKLEYIVIYHQYKI